MKIVRHAKIKEIVEQNIIETQEDLAEELRKQGIEITQATVSRDIKELMLSKVPSGDGRYRYAFPMEKTRLRDLTSAKILLSLKHFQVRRRLLPLRSTM